MNIPQFEDLNYREVVLFHHTCGSEIATNAQVVSLLRHAPGCKTKKMEDVCCSNDLPLRSYRGDKLAKWLIGLILMMLPAGAFTKR